MNSFIPNWVIQLANFGVTPADSEETRVQKAILMVAGTFTCFSLVFMMGPIYVFYEEYAAASIYIGYGSLGFLNILIHGLWHKNVTLCAFLFAIFALPAHLLTALFLGGFTNSHGIILWGLFYPVLGGLVFFTPRQTAVWFLLYMVNVALSIFLQPYLRQSNLVPQLVGYVLTMMLISSSSLFTLGVFLYFVTQRDLAFALLRGEQVKSENLLLNILPAEIATILKEENRVIADHFEGASILFADVVGFTPLSASMPPAELVSLLNEVFSQLDLLAEKYGLEKIKTIGDSYMVAAGVPRPRADHAQILTQMALDMRDLVSQQKFHGRELNFRIGINSGPVVAGVIGRKKFIYDLWGDAVNTASRMESHSKANTIQITRATYELIQDEFVCEPQGIIQVKGKGEMEVWYVVERKEK